MKSKIIQNNTTISDILKKDTSKREKEAFLDKITKQVIREQMTLVKPKNNLIKLIKKSKPNMHLRLGAGVYKARPWERFRIWLDNFIGH